MNKVYLKNCYFVIPLMLILALFNTTHSQQLINKEDEIKGLIEELYKTKWQGQLWDANGAIFWHLPPSMKRLLDIKTDAQIQLIGRLSDAKIKDQVIFILGGVGDEQAIDAIINAMINESDYSSVPNAGQINYIANIALTNITAAAVIFPNKGGGNLVLRCPRNESKACWEEWWKKNRSNFRIQNLTKSDRNYKFYPNYGIYRVFPNQNSYFWDFDAKGHIIEVPID